MKTLIALPLILSAGGVADELDRSPVDVVLSKDGSWLATANQTSDSVSLVRTKDGRLLDELKIGDHPAAIVRHPGGDQLFVTTSHSGELYWLEVVEEKLRQIEVLFLGFQPTGIAIDPDGESAYVALTDADQIAVIDLREGVVRHRIDVGRWPRYLAVSADGGKLAVGTSGDRGISIVDTQSRQLLHVDRFVGLNIGHLRVARDGETVYFPWMVYRRNPITERNIRLGWVLASRLGRIRLTESARREAISLDPPGKAVADVHGLALTSDDRYAVLSAGGTHELLVMATEDLPFQDRGSTDHIDEALLKDERRFFRVEVGGRPMGLTVAKDDRTVYVANYLDNSVQVVDLVTRSVVGRISLGEDTSPSLARQGAAIFFDARRSLDQWYSCHSCHYEGGTNAVAMDTVNDGSTFTFKTVIPLHQVDKTGPWTWHGWQLELPAAMKHSLKTTMLGPPATEGDAQAIIAFLASLPSPPNPFVDAETGLSDAARRGRQIFHNHKGSCLTCHVGSQSTDGQVHDLETGKSEDAYVGFNTPSLRGVFRKVLLMHDGAATSLHELLRGPHAPEKVAGSQLTDEERDDLIEYLKTL